MTLLVVFLGFFSIGLGVVLAVKAPARSGLVMGAAIAGLGALTIGAVAAERLAA